MENRFRSEDEQWLTRIGVQLQEVLYLRHVFFGEPNAVESVVFNSKLLFVGKVFILNFKFELSSKLLSKFKESLFFDVIRSELIISKVR